MENNTNLAGYLRMMTDIITKKKNCLQSILEATQDQARILRSEEFDDDDFSALIDIKAKNIDKVNELDDGFQTVYDKIKAEMGEKKAEHEGQIKALQKLVAEVTELGVQITALEKQNKNTLESVKNAAMRNTKNFKVSRNTASNYYKTMAGLHGAGPSFMDEKQ